MERASPRYIAILRSSKRLSQDVSRLASAERTLPLLQHPAGLAARGEVVKQMESLEEKIDPPRKMDLQSASEQHWALVKGLRDA